MYRNRPWEEQTKDRGIQSQIKLNSLIGKHLPYVYIPCPRSVSWKRFWLFAQLLNRTLKSTAIPSEGRWDARTSGTECRVVRRPPSTEISLCVLSPLLTLTTPLTEYGWVQRPAGTSIWGKHFSACFLQAVEYRFHCSWNWTPDFIKEQQRPNGSTGTPGVKGAGDGKKQYN